MGAGRDGGRDLYHRGQLIWQMTKDLPGEIWDGYTVLQADLKKTRMALDIMGKAHALLEELSESADDQMPPKEILTTTFEQLRAAEVAVQKACTLTGVSRATYYRKAKPVGPMHGPWLPRTPPPWRSALPSGSRSWRC